MDIKDLNKTQLVLLAILLSFITSVVTGITTASLMQQAPPEVVAPINKVVKQTIEKIQQVKGDTIVKTVVVKEEDLIVEALENNKLAVFSIKKEIQAEDGKIGESYISKGLIIFNEGILVADSSLVDQTGVYYAENESGKFKVNFLASNKDGFAFLKIDNTLGEKNDKPNFHVPAFGDLSKMKIGQKILFFGKNIRSSIYDGENLINKEKTDGIVLNLEGEILGLALSGEKSFVPINVVLEAFKAIKI